MIVSLLTLTSYFTLVPEGGGLFLALLDISLWSGLRGWLIKVIQKTSSSIFCLFYTINKLWHYLESMSVKYKYGFYTRESKKIHLLPFKMIRVKIFDPGLINFSHYKPKTLLHQHMLEVSTWKVIKGWRKIAHLQKNGKGFSF